MAARRTTDGGWVGQRWRAQVVPAAPYGWGVVAVPTWGGAPKWIPGFSTRAKADAQAQQLAAR